MAKKIAPDDIRDQILKLFKKVGKSQAELAEASGVSKNTVCQFFSGRRHISTGKATAILRVLSK